MPIFGLVWVASWVSCFFSSSQDLLRIPSALARTVPIQAAYRVSGARDDRLTAFSRDRAILVFSSQPAQPSSLVQTMPQAQPSTLVANLGVMSAPMLSTTSINFLGALKNFFAGFQKFTAVHRATPALQAESKRVASKEVHVDSSGSGFDQCTSIAQRRPDSSRPDSSSTSRGHQHQPSSFYIKIKDSIVGSAPSHQQAIQFAHQLEAALDDANAAPLEQLQPGLVNGLPGGKLGDRVLFTVDQQVADQWDCNAELLAIQWINTLRTALAEPPLALAEAQAKMYGLQETGQRLEGIASWYGPYFHGRQTATGELFDQNDFTAAHPSLPFDTYLRVTNTTNGKAVIVRVNDRGPYFKNRMLDLSREAARCLDSESNGVVSVNAEIMQPMKPLHDSSQAIARGL